MSKNRERKKKEANTFELSRCKISEEKDKNSVIPNTDKPAKNHAIKKNYVFKVCPSICNVYRFLFIAFVIVALFASAAVVVSQSLAAVISCHAHTHTHSTH